MRVSSRLFRISVWLASSSLTLATSVPAFAQPAPPPGAQQADNGDPPAVAGRLAKITGSVSFHASGEDHWNAASLNYPVTAGEAFWTEAQAEAEIEVADSRLVMAGTTELDVATLDQRDFVLTEPQGAVFLQLPTLPQGQSLTVNTPRGAVQITQPGRYEIVAGDTNDATTISVVEGAAHVSGTGLSLDVAANQTATIGGTDTFQGSVGALQQDDFLAKELHATEQEAAPPPQVRQQVQYMTGGSELAQYGSWSQTQQYGQVWYPRDVGSDWAPYRDGHWAYVAPWGWSWVDNAAWGFAPFHYGRWVQVDDRWGWIAGAPDAPADDYPVYSPAMVSFVDVGGAVLAGAAIGFAVGELAGGFAPAWIPLGPREPYYPWYHTRGDYFARINGRYGVPRDIIRRGPTYITNIHQTNIYVNRRAATVMPARAMARGEGVRQAGRPLPERALEGARPVRGRTPVVPTAATPNLGREAARRYNVSLPAGGAERGNRAPGPQIREPGPHRSQPVLRAAALPPNVRAIPAAGVRDGAHGQAGRPSAEPGRPGLRAPGAGRPSAPALDAPGAEGRRSGQPGAPGAGEARPGAPRPGEARPGEVRPGEARPGTPALRAPGAEAPGLGAGDRGGRPGSRPGEARPAEPHPGAAGPAGGGQPGGRNPDAGRPASPEPRGPREQQARPETPHPAPAEHHAAPAARAPRPAPVERHASPRPAPAARPMQAHHAAPRPQAARPQAPRPQAPRPQAPRPQAPRPAPRPAPHPQAPHPAAPHPGGPHKG